MRDAAKTFMLKKLLHLHSHSTRESSRTQVGFALTLKASQFTTILTFSKQGATL